MTVRIPEEGEIKLAHACTAVYYGRTVDVTSTEDEEVLVPLAEGAKVASVVAVPHAADEKPHRFSEGPDGVLVAVPASTGPVRCIRIRW
jgi:hypothetical protein